MATPTPLPPQQPPHEVVDLSSIDGNTESDDRWWEKDPAYDILRGRTFMKAAEKKKLLFEIRAKDVLQMFLHPDSTVHDLFFLLRATKDHQYLADFSAKKILELERLCRKRRCNNMEKRMRSAKLASSQMDPRAIRTLLWLRHR
jgi:hypothetical protein